MRREGGSWGMVWGGRMSSSQRFARVPEVFQSVKRELRGPATVPRSRDTASQARGDSASDSRRYAKDAATERRGRNFRLVTADATTEDASTELRKLSRVFHDKAR